MLRTNLYDSGVQSLYGLHYFASHKGDALLCITLNLMTLICNFSEEKSMNTIVERITLVFIIVLVVTNVSIGQNLIINSGFETGTGTIPDNWSTSIVEGSADFSWVTDVFYSGEKSISISHSDSATSSFYQVIPIQPS